MSLIDAYRRVLQYAGHTADDAGHIYLESDPKHEPVMIDGKEMVLPTSYMLKSVEGRSYFHPFREQTSREVSIATKEYMERLVLRINVTIAQTALALVNVISSPAVHSKMDPIRKRILKSVSAGDSKSFGNLTTALMREVKKGRDMSLVKMFIKKGGSKKVDGELKQYARLAVVFFPYYEDVAETGAKLRKEDQQLMLEIFRFMFEGIDLEQAYSVGSSDHRIPTITAILNAALGLTNRLDELYEDYKEYSEGFDGYEPFKTDWLNDLENLSEFDREISLISNLPGSEGRPNEGATRADNVSSVRVDAAPQRREEPARESRDRPVTRTEERQSPFRSRDAVPEEARTPDGKLKLGFLTANAPQVRNAPNVMDSAVVHDLMAQRERELKEAIDYLEKFDRPHPDHGRPDDVDRKYRNIMRDREYDNRGSRGFRPQSHAEEIAYNEWMKDKDEAKYYFEQNRRPHPQLGHPDEYREFDPRDPRYIPRTAEYDRRYDERGRGGYRDDRGYDRGRDYNEQYRRTGRPDYSPTHASYRGGQRDEPRDRGYRDDRGGRGYDDRDRGYDRGYDRDRGYGDRDRRYLPDDRPAFAR